MITTLAWRPGDQPWQARSARGLLVALNAPFIAIAPFEVVVVVAQSENTEVAAEGERVYQSLLDTGVEVIVDDRTVRAGVKFSDAELVGIPFRITIGKRGVAAGTAELTDRATGETTVIPLDDAAKHVREAIAAGLAA